MNRFVRFCLFLTFLTNCVNCAYPPPPGYESKYRRCYQISIQDVDENFGINLRSINFLCELRGGGIYKFLSTTSDSNSRASKTDQLITAKDIQFVFLNGRYVKMTVNRIRDDWHLKTVFPSATAARDLYMAVREETLNDEVEIEEKYITPTAILKVETLKLTLKYPERSLRIDEDLSHPAHIYMENVDGRNLLTLKYGINGKIKRPIAIFPADEFQLLLRDSDDKILLYVPGQVSAYYFLHFQSSMDAKILYSTVRRKANNTKGPLKLSSAFETKLYRRDFSDDSTSGSRSPRVSLEDAFRDEFWLTFK